MVSSPGGGDYSEPPRGQAPPAGMIAPMGSAAPFNPHFISFLGDTNKPSTGLTPEMLAAINATNGPAPGSMPPQMGGGGPPMRPQADPRAQLAKAMMQQQQQMGLGRNGRASGG